MPPVVKVLGEWAVLVIGVVSLLLELHERVCDPVQMNRNHLLPALRRVPAEVGCQFVNHSLASGLHLAMLENAPECMPKRALAPVACGLVYKQMDISR